eukprot:4683192-Amphidinium_carterae.1
MAQMRQKQICFVDTDKGQEGKERKRGGKWRGGVSFQAQDYKTEESEREECERRQQGTSE